MSPYQYPCSNPFCPHGGVTLVAGELCPECQKRAGVVNSIIDNLEGLRDMDKQRRREKLLRDTAKRKGDEE